MPHHSRFARRISHDALHGLVIPEHEAAIDDPAENEEKDRQQQCKLDDILPFLSFHDASFLLSREW